MLHKGPAAQLWEWSWKFGICGILEGKETHPWAGWCRLVHNHSGQALHPESPSQNPCSGHDLDSSLVVSWRDRDSSDLSSWNSDRVPTKNIVGIACPRRSSKFREKAGKWEVGIQMDQVGGSAWAAWCVHTLPGADWERVPGTFSLKKGIRNNWFCFKGNHG